MISEDQHEVPISTLVVDDEELARNLIATLVRRDHELLLVGECDNGADALDVIDEQRPDLVFLDVQMPLLNGIGVAETLAGKSHRPYLIFVTAYDEFAIKAFELEALDYLVKPIEKQRFQRSVMRAKSAIRRREMLQLTERLLRLREHHTSGTTPDAAPAQELTVRHGDTVLQLTTDDVVWVEAANQYVHIHTRTQRFTVSESLGQYAKRIRDPRFFRIHRSALANGAAVERVTKRRNGTHRLHLDNGETLVVARSRAAIVPDLLRVARQSKARG